MPRHQRQLAARRDRSQPQDSCEVSEEQPYVRLAPSVRRCQAIDPSSAIALSRRGEPIPMPVDDNDKGFMGGVPETPKRSTEKSRGHASVMLV